MPLMHCDHCDFDFFAHDPRQGIAADQLDHTRLKVAGLAIPTVDIDFANGLSQSSMYVTEYMDDTDRGRNILEVGCSWGYFLKLAKEAGAEPFGLEINSIRASYVKDELGIQCDSTLAECQRRGIRFKKIFLFYVLEYVPDPLSYLKHLIDLLDSDGKIIAITPNLKDPLKDIWRNPGFARFFYDEHAINYFSPRSIRYMLRELPLIESVVSTRQGYSFINHLSWHLSNAPRTTGVVGGDNFTNEVVRCLEASEDQKCTEALRLGQESVGECLGRLLLDFDKSYRECLEDAQLGNQIRMILSSTLSVSSKR